MIVSEADAAVLPSYAAYEFAEKVFRPLVNTLGGHAVHGAERMRPVNGRAGIVTPNHLSNWDHFVVGLALLDLPELTRDSEQPDLEPLDPRAIHFMAKESLERVPGVREFIRACGTFTVQRGRGIGLEPHLVDHVGNLMANNALLGIYPQGHRERGPEDEKTLVRDKFKSTAAFLALKYGVPLIPVGLAGPVKGPKFPRTLVFRPPIFTEQMDPEDPGFKAAKDDLMDEVYTGVNNGYQQARELQSQLEQKPGRENHA